MLVNFQTVKNIPKIVLYNPNNGREFRMLDTQTGKYIGEMSVAYEKRTDLYIEKLVIEKSERGKGYGRKFLDFAKNLSKKLNFGGNMRVMAAALMEGDFIPPHIFYRKYGFTTDNKEILNKIDNCIKEKKQLTIKDAPITYMTYTA